MNKINKLDFYCGAFLSYLIGNGCGEPTLFDVTDKSKIINFMLRNKNYNLFLKYSGTSTSITRRGKKHKRWNVTFTQKDMEYLHTSFIKDDSENLILIVCTNESLKDTYFGILNHADAIKCLGALDGINKQHRMVLNRQKGSKYVHCHGTALSDEAPIKIEYNYNKVFGFDEQG